MSSTLDTPPPAIDPDQAARLLHEHYGIEGKLEPLVSERDQNFRVTVTSGERFVLKFSNPAEEAAVVDLQVQALLHLEKTAPGLSVPRVRPTGDGAGFVRTGDCFVRLVTYLDGRPIGNGISTGAAPTGVRTNMGTLGAMLARLGRGLRGFFHPAARHELLWDLQNALQLRELLTHVDDPERRERLAAILDRFERHIAPVLPGLRAQVIHNDFNPDNVLADDAGSVSAVIDFGDLVHAPLVIDLAVAAAYQLADQGDPLAPALALVSAYHAVTPLETGELDVLYDLIATRVATTILIGSWRAARYPENREYLLTSQPKALRLLDALAGIGRAAAAARFRAACGYPEERPPVSDTELQQRREQLLGPAYRLFYDRPLQLVRGAGAWLYDAGGKAYLDVYNNVPHVGHCHPQVVAAVSRQLARLNTHTRYLHEGVVDYAARLLATFPFDDAVCLFCCTGSEANELAYRISMAHTGGTGVVVTDHAYHGNTSTVARFSTADTPPERRGSFVAAVAAPDSYRQPSGDHAGAVAAALEALRAGGIKPAMMLIDTIHSCDGIIQAPAGYLEAAARHVRQAGALLVADEVQAGFGRTGEAFWGFERHGVVPDIVTLGKPMGNGFPLAAVITTRPIIEAFAAQIDYFNTFGGNPVACAAGMAVLDVMAAESLQRNALQVGRYLREELTGLQAEFPLIGDVRGVGLFLGVELVEDRDTKEPAARAAHTIVNTLRERRILIGATGPRRNVLKLRPPMVFGRAEADRLLHGLREVMQTSR